MSWVGESVAVRYNIAGPALWHHRLVLAAGSEDGAYWVLTPDGDVYEESFTDGVRISDFRLMASFGTLPPGVTATRFYRFEAQPSGAEWDGLVRRAHFSAGTPAPAVIPGVRTAAAPPAPPLGLGPGPAVGGADGAAAGHAIVPVADGAPAAHGALVGVAGPVPGAALLALPPPAVGPAVPPPAAAGGGLLGLMAALDGGRGPRIPADGGAGVGSSPDDARTLAIVRDALGHRYRDFVAAVKDMREDPWDDWPITGPRTTLWVLQFICENGGTPMGRHTKFKGDCRLQSTDPGVIAHEKACRALQVACCYDQVNAVNMAVIELLCRDIQVQEERHRGAYENHMGEELADSHLFYGTRLMQGTICVCPLLKEHIAEELHKETQVSKERRKAREERALARPKAKGGPKEKDKDKDKDKDKPKD
jgi:hypothetical protein